jgi:carboxymethylenebutenolidase
MTRDNGSHTDKPRLDQAVVDLYDEYTHRPLPRRVFLERLAAMLGSTAAASAAITVLEPNYAMAQMVAPDDPRLTVSRLDVTTAQGRIAGLLAAPAGNERLPALLVIHENRGLNPHIEDVTRRFALAGFLTLGLDFLTPAGGTPADADQARDMIGKLALPDVMTQGRAALAWLKAAPRGNGKAGAVGFCWGGGIVNSLATDAPELDAGVVFYGRAPVLANVPRIKAPLLMHHASLDTRIVEGLPAYEAAMKAAGTRYTLQMYEGVNHAFHNDTSAERYDKAAATLAFDRSVAFLKQELAMPAKAG